MGMYTEIYVNIDLVEGVSDDVIDTLKCMVNEVFCVNNWEDEYFDQKVIQDGSDRFNELMKDKPARFPWLFSNGSYYTPYTQVSKLSYDYNSGQWSLLGKGDIKNYCSAIETFFEWIAPYSETQFLGYSRYEECDEPTLYFRRDFIEGE
jgi:hypothetical protein